MFYKYHLTVTSAIKVYVTKKVVLIKKLNVPFHPGLYELCKH